MKNIRYILNYIFKFYPYCILSLVVFIVFVDFAYLNFNSPDACIYLSTAENIAHHQGFLVSYNLSQSFKTLYYPIWPYYQYLYSIFCSFFIDHGGSIQVIKINILLFALNVSFVFYIVQQLIPTRLNILFICSLTLSLDFFISALYPWTEQLHFFCFIITFILFLKYFKNPKHLIWLGFLNGVFMLVRYAHFFNVLGYLPFIFFDKAPFREKFNRTIAFVGGFVLFYGLYQMFCWHTYHAFYPQYARSIENYNLADEFGGIVYNLDKVGIQISSGPILSLEHFIYIRNHISDAFKQMPLFLFPALFYYLLPINKRKDGGVIPLCLWQSIFTLLGYSFSFYWTNQFFEPIRYSMIPFVLIGLSGWYCLYQGLSFLGPKGGKFVGLIVLLLLFCLNLGKFIESRKVLDHPRWEIPQFRNLYVNLWYINKNLPKEILVASDATWECYFMHRPYISIPPGKSYNCQNLMLYNKIYSPDYYLLSTNISNDCFNEGGLKYSMIFSNGTFRILKIKKDI